ncbi:hypothetical protein ES319_A05G296700v1 [Gossypium barbadense]|uniref:Sulfotransferase n=3 Tax=Gossypium TaxID=3633 RepID=A0A2P5WSJ8_GOSBA|nr:hypothetical protein ES319_A05G296700v1 [Gossypium barbadense]PPR94061.1 hypothetical protein GOBAR_AA26604 [Gossypium barbadense]TYH18900.1 hypothetical protein ES288_A05G309900v1 [Gossypium darwinii]TYI29392.1 hypothetical protein ES332_A05G313500v1 [Gossypium tomentosum]
MESKKSSLASSTPNISPSASGLTQCQGFWIPSRIAPISSIISFQKYFQALDEDIIVASKPKAGTTWLKALVFTIVNRHFYTLSNTPLNSANPRHLISHFEVNIYRESPNPDLSNIPSPRLFATHLPYPMLADSIKRSYCRIVYITRNPFDIVVSFWHFLRGVHNLPDWSVEDCLEMFCRGEEGYGPFWDHALGYWNMSLEKPSNVLFLRYEEMKEDPVAQTKKLAEFLGFPFSMEEEKTGVVNQIVDFCSFNNLKDLEVNKTGKMAEIILHSNKLYFRSGKVGDYVNYLTPTAVERFNNILEEKLSGSSLTFK